MEIIRHIEAQVAAMQLPLFAVTLTAVPCPDTPVILTLHWHGFRPQRLAEIEGAQVVGYRAIPSSALQLNDRWDCLEGLDRAALEAGWCLGAWDVARAERPACTRPGAPDGEAVDCLRAFAAGALDLDGEPVVVAEAPDADDLVGLAARRGYLTWLFRPVHGGIWGPLAEDDTLDAQGRRAPPCPLQPQPAAGRPRRTVYALGRCGRVLS